MTTPFTVFSGSTSALTNALLAPNSGISVSNIVLNSSGSNAVNFYDGSLLPLGIGAGLLLTSGTTPGTSNTTSGFGQNNNALGDPDIDTVVNTVFQTKSYDATTLAFDFTVSNPNATSVTFDLVMGSEEYPEFVNSFVDSAVVLINGVNYALFGHNALNPLSVISQNVTAGYFQDNANNLLPIEYDGVSQMLKIVVPIKSGTNHIKIGIADTGDSVLDSGVFIANLLAGSTPGSGVVTSSNSGTLNNDTITGSAKDEYLELLAGNDIAYADAGDDIMVAGAGNDTVYGGDGNDQIQGDTGNDSIDGGDGTDTAIFDGNKPSYKVSKSGSNYTVTSVAEGIDTLTNVEFLKFNDGTFPIDSVLQAANNAPTGLVIISGDIQQGKILTASNTLTDADGLGTISYQWLSGGNVISGATQANYTLTATDVGKTITVKASYTDLKGTAESMTSSPTALVITSQSGNGGTIFNANNDIYLLQASDNLNISKGIGDDKYILSNGGGVRADQSISIIDTQGTNTFQLIDGLTIASSKATSNAIELTLSNGGIVKILGAATYHFEVGGDPLHGIAGTIQDFSTFLTSSLGFSTLPTSTSSLVTGASNVLVNSNGTTSVSSGLNSIVLPVGQTTTGLTTTVAATNAADIFTLNVSAAKASAPNTQDVITGFNVTADKLALSGTGITPGTYTLANTLAGIGVSTDPFAAQPTQIVNFGSDADGGLITLSLVGVTTANLVNVTIVS